MRLPGKILTVLFIIVMMVNAVGIAQVTHICKMAVAGIEKADCTANPLDKHPCCSNEKKSPSEQDCCKNIIKYYHQKVNTTFQPSYKIHSLNFFISLLVIPFKVTHGDDVTPSFGMLPIPIEKTGQSIILDLQTFLI